MVVLFSSHACDCMMIDMYVSGKKAGNQWKPRQLVTLVVNETDAMTVNREV